MAEYPIFSQPRGPDISVSLFPDAMTAGTNVGNAQKSTGQAIAEGITGGIQAYENVRVNEANIEGKELANEKARIENENLAEKEQADIEAKRAAAQHNQALAEYQQNKLAEQQQEDALITNVARGLSSKDPNAINSILSDESLYKLILKDPKKFEGLSDAISAIPGVDQTKLGFLEDFTTNQKIRNEYEKKAIALAPDILKAEAELNTDYLAGQLKTQAQNVTGNAYTRADTIARLHTASPGEFIVEKGQLVKNPAYDPVVAMQSDGKVDTFLREKDSKGNDVYYPLRESVDLKDLKETLKNQGVLQLKVDLEDQLRGVTRRRNNKNAAAGVSSSTQGTTQAAPASPARAIPYSSDKVKKIFSNLAANKSFDEIETAIIKDPSVGEYVKRQYKINDERLKEAAPAIANIYRELEAVQGSSISEEYVKATKDFSKAIALTEFDALKKRADKDVSSKIQLDSYNESAIERYKREKILATQAALQDYTADWVANPVIGLYFGRKKLLADLSRYSEDVKTPEDLYYARNKPRFDNWTRQYVEQMQRDYKADIGRPEAQARANKDTSEQNRNLKGEREPLVDIDKLKSSFNFSAELSGSAHAEEMPEPEYNAVETGAEIGMITGEKLTPEVPSGPMTKQEAQDYIVEAAKKYNIPEHIAIGLAAHESAWKENAKSSAGAIGYMQLMPETAKELGVDPNDPKQNIEGGLKYLAKMYALFGNWDLAINAYNAGPGNVRKYKGRVPFSETKQHLRGVKKKAAEYLESKKTYA